MALDMHMPCWAMQRSWWRGPLSRIADRILRWGILPGNWFSRTQACRNYAHESSARVIAEERYDRK
jgi:hypothetical protein